MNLSLASAFRRAVALALAAVLAAPAFAAVNPQIPEWVQCSNENAKLLLDVTARFAPENAAATGVEGIDEQIIDLKPGFPQRRMEADRKVQAELRQRLAAEKDPLVRQDLEILIKAVEQDIRGLEISLKYDYAVFNLPRLVFFSMRSLLDDQVAEKRRPAALVRLKRYTGMEPGYTPLTELALDYMRQKNVKPGLVPPVKAEVEKDLADAQFFVDGVGKLFEKYKVAGYQDAYARLKQQLTAYNDYVRREVLPKARTDFRLPEEQYAYNLETFGVDVPPAQLAAMARAAFADIQKQMQALAPQVAKQHGLQVTDYRDVIRELKKKQLVGEAILPHYHERLKQIEGIVRRERLVTLPTRPARIRLASEAESAAIPAPNMRAPRLLGNTGEQGEFILPLNVPDASGKMRSFDDFTFEAASWTLTAHEARPGHEMQFASVIEKGVSMARALYAFNSTNVEGWGLYAEKVLLPYMPPDGQLISLQHRLMRAARAFLDPELQLGKVTREEAFRVLREDVGLSEAMATQEVERYTFRAPGQATSYFYGFTRLEELRRDVEKALGPKFDQQKFHDFVLAQGLLPPDLLRKAVMAEFAEHKAARN